MQLQHLFIVFSLFAISGHAIVNLCKWYGCSIFTLPTDIHNILGKPNEGFHATSFLGFAAYDLIGTAFIALAIAQYYKFSRVWTLIVTFVIAQLVHLLLGVNTRFVTNVLGINF